MESKIIVLQNELSEERKKLMNQAGLEKTVSELRKQLDLKTSEVVDLSDLIEKDKEVHEENVRLNARINELEQISKQLGSENEEIKEQNWNLSRKIESINSCNEQEKLRLVELVSENGRILKELESSREQLKRKRIEFAQKLEDCERKLAECKEELDSKNLEFENYKSKVFKVLNEKESNHLELHELKVQNQDYEQKIASYEAKISSLLQELETMKLSREESHSDRVRFEKEQNSVFEKMTSQLEESRREIFTLKSFNRELQSQLVLVKSEQEDKMKCALQFDSVSKKLEQVEAEKQRLELRLSNLANENISHEFGGDKMKLDLPSESTTLTRDHELCRDTSPKSVDDVDSIGSTSLSSRTKRLSVSSVSDPVLGMSNNVLEELMSLKFEEEDHNESDRGSGRVDNNEEKNLDRFSELLEESEAANVLLTEQNRVLKEEIRRLERAMARIELAQNLEYLKNVLVKFVSLENGSSEKRQLVSVLKTILKLSEEEESVLIQEATRNDPSSQNSSTWTSYIWS